LEEAPPALLIPAAACPIRRQPPRRSSARPAEKAACGADFAAWLGPWHDSCNVIGMKTNPSKTSARFLVSGIAIAAVALIPAFQASSEPKKESVLVFAASSLTDFVEKAGKEFTAKHPEYRLSTNYASASALAKQIENAPMDLVFLSAHPKWTKYLIDKGVAKEDRVLFGNELVIAAPGRRSAPAALVKKADAPGAFLSGRIAVGDPESVPAGEYAKEALTSLGWYEAVKARLIPCASVRAALQALLSGEADRAIVFRTDLSGRNDSGALALFPDESHSPILYTAALVSTKAAAPSGPAAFLDFLVSGEGMAIARDLGFRTGGAAP
jgi:molybdate transport system substrate-binding protein